MKNNYVVIGGQYYYCSYGAYPTLIGAKRVAAKNAEYWDNWQGWHIPKIYRLEDTEEGEHGRYPIPGAEPVAVGYLQGDKVRWN